MARAEPIYAATHSGQSVTRPRRTTINNPSRTSAASSLSISQSMCTKRDCPQSPTTQDQRPTKKLRTAEGIDSDPPPLSEESQKNLGLLYQQVMETAASNGLKRSWSQRSTVQSEADTVRSQRSSNSAAHYRYKHLKEANVHIHTDPPLQLQEAIDHIITTKPSESRLAVIHDKAKIFQKESKEMVQAAVGEDDFVHILYRIIRDMSPDTLVSREKSDWRVELKPKIQQSKENLDILLGILDTEKQPEVGDTFTPPPKRNHQLANRYISPVSFQNSQPPKSNGASPIRTPRPDVTTGIGTSAIQHALATSLSLSNSSYTKLRAAQFLNRLQSFTLPSGQDGPSEPALIMMPTQRESCLIFPTLIFEGKGYSTGKQVFEAQNQAAVSGASGVKIQMMLGELVKEYSPEGRTPLVFTICSEGPHHELWAHYTVVEDGQHQFHMTLLNTCNGVILDQVEKFLVQVDNVLRWTAGPFLKSVVDDLEKLARKAMESEMRNNA